MKTRPYIIPIFIPFLGCPFTCVYCHQEKISGQPSQLPSIAEIRSRIDAFLATRRPKKYSHTEVAFYGGTFTGLPNVEMRSLLEAVQPYLRSGEVRSLRASTKPDWVKLEVLQELKEAGMRTIELGVQSLDDEVLKKVGRGYTERDVGNAVDCIRQAELNLGLQLMPGLPGSSEEEAVASVKKAIALKPDFVRIYPTVVLKNTALEAWYRQGKYQPWELEQAVRVCRELKALLQATEIPIIKMGLEFSSDEAEGIVAGPYHPEFWKMVLEA